MLDVLLSVGLDVVDEEVVLDVQPTYTVLEAPERVVESVCVTVVYAVRVNANVVDIDVVPDVIVTVSVVVGAARTVEVGVFVGPGLTIEMYATSLVDVEAN